MVPFCGYNMGDYFQHWLNMGDRLGENAPRIFYINWFRKDGDGNFLWPGYGENSRVLKWMCERVDGKAEGRETPIGILPKEEDLDLSGLEMPAENLKELLWVDADEWRAEVPGIEEFFNTFGDRLPQRLRDQLEQLRQRLG